MTTITTTSNTLTISNVTTPITAVTIEESTATTVYDFNDFNGSLLDIGTGIAMRGVLPADAIMTDEQWSGVAFVYTSNAIILPQTDSDFFQVTLSPLKTEVVGIDVSEWASGQDIASITITSGDESILTVLETSITGSILLARVSGVAVGVTSIEFNYSTVSRQDCFTGRVCVEDC